MAEEKKKTKRPTAEKQPSQAPIPQAPKAPGSQRLRLLGKGTPNLAKMLLIK
jgi:hypothetical protein